MDIIDLLYAKDDKEAYEAFKKLETVSEASNELYKYFDKFLEMLSHEKSYVRVRAFRLICKNAKWDSKNKINASIGKILSELDDEKPTAVRQCLAALKDIVENKKELVSAINTKLLSIDHLKYKDSMQGLIFKDINEVLSLLKQ